MKLKLALVLIFGWFMLITSAAKATSGTGKLIMRVLNTHYIQASEPLTFTHVLTGSDQARFPSAEGKNASIKFRGEPYSAYQINLPEVVTLTTSKGFSSNQKIKVNNFKISKSVGQFDSKGEQVIYVGATREPWKNNQQAGTYTGTFTLQIIY